MSSILVVLVPFLLASCDDGNDPVKEDTPEMITKVTLRFTPDGAGQDVTATATDPDGDGVQSLSVDGPVNLAVNTSYNLFIELINELAAPSEPDYDISAEVAEEGDEHMIFFSWTNDVFGNPAGNGNIDNRGDAVNYEDEDGEGQPIGLQTSWTTSSTTASGKFRVLLKHQPELKSATSGATTGESDLDITFDINIQ